MPPGFAGKDSSGLFPPGPPQPWAAKYAGQLKGPTEPGWLERVIKARRVGIVLSLLSVGVCVYLAFAVATSPWAREYFLLAAGVQMGNMSLMVIGAGLNMQRKHRTSAAPIPKRLILPGLCASIITPFIVGLMAGRVGHDQTVGGLLGALWLLISCLTIGHAFRQ